MSKEYDETEMKRIIDNGFILADKLKHEYYTVEHLLYILLKDAKVKEIITDLGGNVKALTDQLDVYFGSGMIPIGSVRPRVTTTLQNTILISQSLVLFSGRAKPKGYDVLVGLLKANADPEKCHAVYFLAQQGITYDNVVSYVAHEMERDEDDTSEINPLRRSDAEELAGGATKPGGTPVKMTEDKAKKILDAFCSNLNERAKESKIDPLIGRESEVTKLALILARRTKNNAIMVGEPGVGKTAIAEGLAKKIVEKTVPEILWDSTVFSLDVGALIAGTRYRGDFEERLKQVLKALTFVPKSILFIDEIHNIMGAGAAGNSSLDVANLLKPALQKGELRCIGSTTEDEYRKYFEKDRALMRRFGRLSVFEPSIADAKMILRGLAPYYKEFFGVEYSQEALDAAVELSSRYMQNKFLPDKAIDLMDLAGARQKIKPAADRKKVIGLAEIEFEVSEQASIPPATVKEDERDKLMHLESDFKMVVFGQDKSIEALVDAVVRSRAGLQAPNRPLGSYVFTGPTGVGKTEVARQLAKTLGLKLLKYDMSEFMEKHTVSRLIGAPPGYVGFEDGQAGGGQLINDVEKYPHCVLLLDEIEKAHPNVFNLLLQVMDSGKLTASNGKQVDFSNLFLIMTSNAGAAEMEKSPIGFGTGSNTSDADDRALKDLFKPEFRNRLDAIIKFGKLSREHILLIVDKFLNQLNKLSLEKGVTIELDASAKEHLADIGFTPEMGARPMDRAIRENITTQISREMIFGKLRNGGQVTVTYNRGKLNFSYKSNKSKKAVKQTSPQNG